MAAPVRRMTSVFLHASWDEDEEYACCPVIKDCGAATLRHLLKEYIGEINVNKLRTTAQLRAAAKKCKLHERKLKGADALRHRAGIVVSMLSRLERRAPDARAALTNATLERRGQWVVVTKADHEKKEEHKSVNAAEKLEHQLEEKVKKAVQTRAEKRKAFLVANQKAASAGSAISAVDGHDTLLATFEATEKAVDVAFRKRKPITFRMAPFYSGWVEAQGLLIDGVRYCVLAYGSLALFDQEAAPRKKLASLKLHGAVVEPQPSDLERNARVEVRRGNRRITLRPPPHGSKYHKKAAALVDMAAILIVAIGHANGSPDIKELEVFRRKGAADDTAAMQPTLKSNVSTPTTPMVRIRAPSPSIESAHSAPATPATPAAVDVVDEIFRDRGIDHDTIPPPAPAPAPAPSPAAPAPAPAAKKRSWFPSKTKKRAGSQKPAPPPSPAAPAPAPAKSSFWEKRARAPAPAPAAAPDAAAFLADAIPAEREPIGKETASEDVEVRLKALQKLEASIDVITTTTMVAKVDKALQAFGGGSPDPRVQATVARIRTKAAAKDVSAGTKALRRLRRRHKLKQGWARLRLPRWDSTDEDDVFALQAPATTPVAMKVKASPDPTPETPPFVPPFPGSTPSPNRKIVRRLVRRVVSASKDGVEVVIVDGKRMRRVVRRVGDAPSSGGKRVRRVRVIKRRRSFEAVH